MAWYGQSVAPYVLLIPPGVAGLLLPYLGRRPDPKLASLGNILAFAVLSSVLTHYKLGASILGTIWSLAGLLALSDVSHSVLGFVSGNGQNRRRLTLIDVLASVV